MKKLTGSRIGNLIVVAAVIIVPLLYAGLLTLAYQNPTNRLDDLTAAVVNEDTAYTATLADGSHKTLNLGKELQDTLTAPDGSQDVGFHWISASASQAEADMKTEKVRAILYIPAGFSEKVAQVGSSKPAQAATQQLRLVTDDGVNYLAGTMAKSVATELSNRLEEQGSSEIIDTLLMSVSTIRDGMSDAADGSSQLAQGTNTLTTGTTSLTEGTSQLAEGANTLSVGVKQLADGSVTLTSGLTTLSSGTDSAASGSQQLADGVGQLASGTATAASGSQTLADGASRLAAGTNQLAAGAAPLADGVNQLSTGASKLDGGLATYTAGVDTLASGAAQLQSTLNNSSTGLAAAIARLQGGIGQADDQYTAGGHNTLSAGVNAVIAGAQQLSDGLNTAQAGAQVSLKDGSAALASQLGTLSDGVSQYTKGVDTLAAKCQQLTAVDPDPALAGICQGISQASAQSETLRSGASQAASGAGTIAGGVGQVADGASQLASSAAGLTDGVDQLREGATKLSAAVGAGSQESNPQTVTGAVNQIAGGLNQVAANSKALTDGSAALRNNLSLLNGKIPSLVDGVTSVDAGATQLSQGAQDLAGGLSTLSQGAGTASQASQTLAQGLARLSSGASQAEAGAQNLSSHLATASDGAATLASGATQVNDGATQLHDGATKLADGATTLDEGLRDGVQKIPAYSDSDRQTMSSVGSDVATVDAVRDNAVHNNGAGFTPMFMSLSLWIGAIALFLVLPALDKRDHGEHWWASAIRPATTALLLAVAQAIIMMVAVNAAGELHAKNLLGLAAMAVAASVCFMAVNQACVASLAFRGRFVSIVLLSLQITSMGATFPIETTPKFFQWVHPFLPMSYTQLSFRRLIAGGGVDGIYLRTLAVLAVWTLIAVAVTLLGARLRRGRKPLPADNALAPTAA